ncbi:MAG TPA: hypothetical protein DCX22_03050 [Dehalococcoidia bacterium]|nr:hypothetical protein [Dehalococcoidia bacterium]
MITLYVDPMRGDDKNSGSKTSPFLTIQKAIDRAQPGTMIMLEKGNYLQNVITKRNGTPSNPIIIKGTASAVLKGGGGAHIFEINHSYITLDGFTIDGLFGNPDKAIGYRDKLIYAIGKEAKCGVTDLRILNMILKNSGEEAVRLRYFAHDNEIAWNTITNCGVYDFKFGGGADNGEGIYIGTAPNQLNDGRNSTNDLDQSDNNWIHHNTIDTQGAECVDIKEGSSGNIVEYNTCSGQQNPNTAGLQSRGTFNVFRNNTIFGNAGAGIRLGSDMATEGINNDVYENDIHDNNSGGIKFMSQPQGKVCSNRITDNTGGDSVGAYWRNFSPTSQCEK